MRILGLDLGTRTLGLAISDKLNIIASPYKVLRWDGVDYALLFHDLDNIIKDNDITELCLGLPKNMNNTFGDATKRSMDFKAALEERYKIPVTLVDERLSTVEATNYLLDEDMSRKKRKKVIDGVAASIILDTYLKMRGN